MHGCGLMHLTFTYKTQLCKGFYHFGHAAFIHLQPHHTGKLEIMSLLVIQHVFNEFHFSINKIPLSHLEE